MLLIPNNLIFQQSLVTFVNIFEFMEVYCKINKRLIICGSNWIWLVYENVA